MKRIGFVFSILFILIGSATVYASDGTEKSFPTTIIMDDSTVEEQDTEKSFPTTIIMDDSTVEEQEFSIRPLHVFRLNGEPDQRSRITSYDVNEKKEVIVLFGGNIVGVYSSDGTFMYGYDVPSPAAGAVDASWHGENLLIRWYREDILEEFLPDGTLVNVQEVDPKMERESKKHRTEDGSRYERVWCGSDSPINTKIVAIDPDGMTTLICQTNRTWLQALIGGGFLGIYILLVLLLTVLNRKIKKRYL